jgi:hypothetical protein
MTEVTVMVKRTEGKVDWGWSGRGQKLMTQVKKIMKLNECANVRVIPKNKARQSASHCICKRSDGLYMPYSGHKKVCLRKGTRRVVVIEV